MTQSPRQLSTIQPPPPTDSPAPGRAAMPETALLSGARPPIAVAWAFADASRKASHPRGLKPTLRGLRLCLFLLACVVMLTNSGCPSMTLWRRNDPKLSKADPPLPLNASSEEILARINQNAYSEFSPEGLKSYRCDDVRVRMQGVPAPMRASMVVEAPRNLRLRVANPLSGGEAVDIGSNEEQFWMWAKDSKPANVLVCAHDQIAVATQVTSLPLPFRPDWLMEVLGVSPISGSKYEVRRAKPKSPIAELISVQHTPDQQPVRRIVKVNTMYGVVLEHRVESMEGKMIARAALSHHWRDPVTRLILPRQIAIDWPAADQTLALTLELNTVDFNPPAESMAMWQVPQLDGFPEFDLGEYALKQLGHSGADIALQRRKTPPVRPRKGQAILNDDLEAPEVYASPDSDGRSELGAESWTQNSSLETIDRPIRSASSSDDASSWFEDEAPPPSHSIPEELSPEDEAAVARPFPGD